MCHHVASNRLLWVGSVGHPTARIGCHLVRHVDNDVELFGKFLESVEHFVEHLLSLSYVVMTIVYLTHHALSSPLGMGP